MNIRGFNAIDYTSNANNINFKVLDNIESKVQLLPLNSSKATEDIDFTGDFDPDPKAITYANEIMNAINSKVQENLKRAIKNMPAKYVFDVLELCIISDSDKEYVCKAILNSGCKNLLLSKIVKNVNDREDLPKEYRSNIIYDIATEQNVILGFRREIIKKYRNITDLERFIKDIEYAQRAIKPTESYMEDYFKAIEKDCIFGRCVHHQECYKNTIDAYNKEFHSNIKNIFKYNK